MHEETKFHEDNFAQRVNFARVTILHGGLFLHDNNKKTEKKTEKNLKDKLLKKQNEKKKLLTEGKG